MNTHKPFAKKIQSLLVPMFIMSFLLIMQRFNITIYKVGIILLIITALMQNIFGNIPPEADVRETMRQFVKIFLIIVIIFTISIVIAPLLLNMGMKG